MLSVEGHSFTGQGLSVFCAPGTGWMLRLYKANGGTSLSLGRRKKGKGASVECAHIHTKAKKRNRKKDERIRDLEK